MHRIIRRILSATVALAFTAPAVAAQLPSRHGQSKVPFSTTDFAKLHWLEGDWAGTAPDQTPLYVRYKFTSDSTIDVTYFRDQAFSQPSGSARLYLSVGRVFHTFGPNRWGATRVGADEVFFVPQASIRSFLDWKYVSPDEWTATQRSGVGGHESVTVYRFRRVK